MSDSKFDDKIKKALEGHEPEVDANWEKMRDRIAAAVAIGAVGVDAAGSKIATQLSIGAAVIIGAASMWIAQTFIEDEVVEDEVQVEEVVQAEEVVGDIEGAGEDVTQNLSPNNTPSDNEVEKVASFLDKENTQIESSKGHENSLSDDSNSIEVSESEETTEVNSNEENSETAVEEIEEVPFAASSQTSCVGAQVSFEVEGSDESMSYLWNFGDGNFSSDPNPEHTYDLPGVYDVTLSLMSKGKGSIKTRTIENLITINPLPKADISWTFPRIVTTNKVPLDLVDMTADANDATWIVDGEILSNSNPVLDNPGKYDVNLIASNQFGCQDHTSKTVIVGNRNQLNAPARFSPDGDGRYDDFMPFGLKGLTEKWELVIADKTGEEVYSASKFDEPWKGVLPSGELAPNSSLFYWTVVCTDFDGNQRIYTDKITIER